jgi:hypothetical protein
MKSSYVILAASIVSGCAPGAEGLKSATSGEIGCAVGDIQVADDTGGFTDPRTWTAHCNGKKYFCSGGSGSMKASCKEAQK